uniref:WRKY transcription factor 19 n=1 Tax=Timema tahoe TaxID=61484 RepID=A0A7R9NY63_9NEOP|nr:unnamed protein product [Timema tahoe]
MERETFTVKTEPEDDLKYILHYEEKFEIKSEIDILLKSEENFKEEVHDYQEPEYSLGPLTFPPIKEELPKHPGNFILSTLPGQCGTSQNIYKELVSDSIPNNINGATQEEDNFSIKALFSSKRFGYRLTSLKKICEEEGCSKWARKGSKCLKHGGTEARYWCKQEGCSKQVVRVGKCWKHGGRYVRVKKRCGEEGCYGQAKRGSKCVKHGGTDFKKTCKEEGCYKHAQTGGKLLRDVKKKGALIMLGEEENVFRMEDTKSHVMSFIIPPFSRPSRSSRLLLRPSRLSSRGPVPRSSSPS